MGDRKPPSSHWTVRWSEYDTGQVRQGYYSRSPSIRSQGSRHMMDQPRTPPTVVAVVGNGHTPRESRSGQGCSTWQREQRKVGHARVQGGGT